jgi:hypothetical protein
MSDTLTPYDCAIHGTTGDGDSCPICDPPRRLVEEIVENVDGLWATASMIHEVQMAAAAFTDEFRDPNKPDRPVLWDVVDYHNIPRAFFLRCLDVVNCEVRL